VKTSFYRWAAGAGWVPWSDETQFKMDVIPDKARYAVGDTATVLFASPFTNAEAWITVEREGTDRAAAYPDHLRLDDAQASRSLRHSRRTSSCRSSSHADEVRRRARSTIRGRPTIRVGYAELRVTPEVKATHVTVAAERSEISSSRFVRAFAVQVRDAQDADSGARSRCGQWTKACCRSPATRRPTRSELMYQERGLGMRLASNMTTVAPQIPEERKASAMPAAGGRCMRRRRPPLAVPDNGILPRHRDHGCAGQRVAGAKLPDNITNFPR
jgi:hypothetical protein